MENSNENNIKEIAKDLCDKSGCHHKCSDTDGCSVEDDAKELFKQALVEGVNRRIDKDVEIEVITYEQDRFNHFINLMEKAQKQYDRLYKRYKDSPYLFEGTTLLSDAGRELQFYKDVIAILEQGNRKQSEWISVDERLPEDVYGKGRKQITVLVCTESGKVSTTSRQRIVKFDKDKLEWVELDIFEWSKRKRVTHWMPLPEPPKMKGDKE